MPVHNGSPVNVSTSAFIAAQQSSTATAMARALLMSVFDIETLMNSNLKGGTSKRSGQDDVARLQKLDEDKVEAIYGECLFTAISHLK
jgi:hypothetical protein